MRKKRNKNINKYRTLESVQYNYASAIRDLSLNSNSARVRRGTWELRVAFFGVLMWAWG